jgi:hypothetical protein
MQYSWRSFFIRQDKIAHFLLLLLLLLLLDFFFIGLREETSLAHLQKLSQILIENF